MKVDKADTKSIFVFGLMFVVIDQVLKIFLSSKMVVDQSIIIVKNFWNITLVHNVGAAFNILSGGRWLLVSFGVIALIFLLMVVYSQKFITDLDIFVYSLIFGGIIGNLIDRVWHGYVVDYLSFQVGNYFLPVFNFADVCIVLAVLILIIQTVKGDLWK